MIQKQIDKLGDRIAILESQAVILKAERGVLQRALTSINKIHQKGEEDAANRNDAS